MDFNVFFDLVFIAETEDYRTLKDTDFTWNRMIRKDLTDELDDPEINRFPIVQSTKMMIRYVNVSDDPVQDIVSCVKEAQSYAQSRGIVLNGKIIAQSVLFPTGSYCMKLCMELKENRVLPDTLQ